MSERSAIDPDLGRHLDVFRRGAVDLIAAYSSDGRIDAFDLEVLLDPEQAFPPYDAILLLSPEAARDRELRATLKPLVNAAKWCVFDARLTCRTIAGRQPRIRSS